MNKICNTCKITFEGRGNTRYCSKECGKRQRTYWKHHTLTCLTCKIEYRSRNPTQQYCSTICYGKKMNKSKEVNCAWCGKTISKPLCKLKRNTLFFCNKSHKAKADTKDGPHKAYRKYALRELPNECIVCEYDKDIRMLDVDHINSDRKNNSLDNLQLICVWCHALKTRT